VYLLITIPADKLEIL